MDGICKLLQDNPAIVIPFFTAVGLIRLENYTFNWISFWLGLRVEKFNFKGGTLMESRSLGHSKLKTSLIYSHKDKKRKKKPVDFLV